ncbi:Immunodominant staphylococcal antigen A precursor [Staphylococcus aureus]|nr:Immunodominant staphylococcal antigen A precursor [Staphylococcus aureus]
MKKTIMASSLAVALGVTGYAAGTGHQAHAAEVNVDQAHLVDLAHNHQDQLNAAPIKDGAYDIHFVKDCSNITLLQMVLHGHGAMKQLMVKLLVSQTLQVQTTLLHTTKVQMYNQ